MKRQRLSGNKKHESWKIEKIISSLTCLRIIKYLYRTIFFIFDLFSKYYILGKIYLGQNITDLFYRNICSIPKHSYLYFNR